MRHAALLPLAALLAVPACIDEAAVAAGEPATGAETRALETELVYETEPEQVEAASDVLRARLGERGAVHLVEGGTLLVQLPTRAGIEEIRALLEAPGRLELLIQAQPKDWGALDSEAARRDLMAWIETHPDAAPSSWPPPPDAAIVWAEREREGLEPEERIVALVPPKETDWRLTQDDLAQAKRGTDDFGYPSLGLEFTGLSAKAMHAFTSAHVGDDLAILLDRRVLTLARLVEPLDGWLQVRGNPEEYSEVLVDRWVAQLRSGALPAPLRFVEQR